VSWNGKNMDSMREVTADDLNKMQRSFTDRPDPPLRFTARGGLGVYVEGGSASFRNLRIIPHPGP
jgi:hypothetical protein